MSQPTPSPKFSELRSVFEVNLTPDSNILKITRKRKGSSDKEVDIETEAGNKKIKMVHKGPNKGQKKRT